MDGRPTQPPFARILLVEDDPADVMLMKHAFSKHWTEYDLRIANDGEQALAMLHRQDGYEEEQRPDLILLDLNMPKVNGYEVLQDIKADTDLRQIPTVVLTTAGDQESMVKSYQLHANSFITKPAGLGKLNEMIDAVVRYWFGAVALPAKP